MRDINEIVTKRLQLEEGLAQYKAIMGDSSESSKAFIEKVESQIELLDWAMGSDVQVHMGKVARTFANLAMF